MKALLAVAGATLLLASAAQAQAPRSRVEAAAFCYEVIRYTAGGGTDQRYRVCMADLGYPLPKAKDKSDLRENQ